MNYHDVTHTTSFFPFYIVYKPFDAKKTNQLTNCCTFVATHVGVES